jgi:hypothetical protein
MKWLWYRPCFKHGFGKPGYVLLGEAPTEARIESAKDEVRELEGDPEGFREPLWEIVDSIPPDVLAAKIEEAKEAAERADKWLSLLQSFAPHQQAAQPEKLAPAPQQAAQGGEREAKRLVSDLVFAVCAQENAPSALHHSQYVAAREAVEAALLARAAQGGREGLTALTDEEFLSLMDSDGTGPVDPSMALTIKELVERAHEIGITTPAGDSAASQGGSGGGA